MWCPKLRHKPCEYDNIYSVIQQATTTQLHNNNSLSVHLSVYLSFYPQTFKSLHVGCCYFRLQLLTDCWLPQWLAVDYCRLLKTDLTSISAQLLTCSLGLREAHQPGSIPSRTACLVWMPQGAFTLHTRAFLFISLQKVSLQHSLQCIWRID